MDVDDGFVLPSTAVCFVERAVGIFVHAEGEVAFWLVNLAESTHRLERDGVLEDHVLCHRYALLRGDNLRDAVVGGGASLLFRHGLNDAEEFGAGWGVDEFRQELRVEKLCIHIAAKDDFRHMSVTLCNDGALLVVLGGVGNQAYRGMVGNLQDKAVFRVSGDQTFHVLLDVVNQAVQGEEGQRWGGWACRPG